jgi:NAD(P)-dependent dehydrogenase (short-subunit alcohol dehydrogenase family)
MESNSTRVVVITGASTGIGRAIAQHLAARGFSILAGVRKESDRASLDAIAGIEAVLLDVTNEAHIESIAARLDSHGSGLFALINNAGHNYNAAFEHTDDRLARELMEVNFFGLYRLTRRLIPALRLGARVSNQSTKVINVSSIGGLFGLPWEAFYHASKFAVMSLTESLRQELWQQNIRAVALCPGGIRTEFMPKTEASISAAIESLPPETKNLYEPGLRTLLKRITLSGKFGSAPELVATVSKACRHRRAPACVHGACLTFCMVPVDVSTALWR